MEIRGYYFNFIWTSARSSARNAVCPSIVFIRTRAFVVLGLNVARYVSARSSVEKEKETVMLAINITVSPIFAGQLPPNLSAGLSVSGFQVISLLCAQSFVRTRFWNFLASFQTINPDLLLWSAPLISSTHTSSLRGVCKIWWAKVEARP